MRTFFFITFFNAFLLIQLKRKDRLSFKPLWSFHAPIILWLLEHFVSRVYLLSRSFVTHPRKVRLRHLQDRHRKIYENVFPYDFFFFFLIDWLIYFWLQTSPWEQNMMKHDTATHSHLFPSRRLGPHHSVAPQAHKPEKRGWAHKHRTPELHLNGGGS